MHRGAWRGWLWQRAWLKQEAGRAGRVRAIRALGKKARKHHSCLGKFRSCVLGPLLHHSSTFSLFHPMQHMQHSNKMCLAHCGSAGTLHKRIAILNP
eukprot:scaffold1272_cov250-Pinguiococcus_pyrenoidosus.AAC.67